MEMTFCPLYSGSSGNCSYVRCGSTSILIDAGLSGRAITDALQYIGVKLEEISAILITHEHADHIKGAGILCRRLKIPLYATPGTWTEMDKKIGEVPRGLRRVFNSGEDFYLGQIGVVPFHIPHDAADPVGFRLWSGGVSVTTCTDLGRMTAQVRDAVAGSSLLLLESNHDPDMLMANEHYSSALKRRILGNHGHLSNEAAAEAVVSLRETGVRNVILGHLSGENNTPRLALTTSETRCELEGMRLGEDIRLELAWRDRVGAVYTVSPEGIHTA